MHLECRFMGLRIAAPSLSWNLFETFITKMIDPGAASV